MGLHILIFETPEGQSVRFMKALTDADLERCIQEQLLLVPGYRVCHLEEGENKNNSKRAQLLATYPIAAEFNALSHKGESPMDPMKHLERLKLERRT